MSVRAWWSGILRSRGRMISVSPTSLLPPTVCACSCAPNLYFFSDAPRIVKIAVFCDLSFRHSRIEQARDGAMFSIIPAPIFPGALLSEVSCNSVDTRSVADRIMSWAFKSDASVLLQPLVAVRNCWHFNGTRPILVVSFEDI